MTLGQEQVPPTAPASAGVSLGQWGESQPPEPPSEDDKLWGMLANFLGIIWLLGPIAALITKGNSKFVKFNALQMIFLCLVLLPVSFVLGSVFYVLNFVPVVGWLILTVFSPMLSLACLLLIIFLGLKANKGLLFKLPLIGLMAYKNAYGG